MRRIFLRTLASILALLGLTSISQAQWVAFNDHVPGVGTHPNATTLKIPAVGGPTSTNMLLKNIGNGTNLPVTLTITRSSAGVTYNANGSGPASGTPMFNTFNGFVSFAAAADCNVELSNSLSGSITYTFSGLNPARKYSFIGGAVRGNTTQTNRWTKIELQSAASATAAHSAHVLTISNTAAAVNFGFNSAATNGDQVDWESIDPGPDGTISFVCTHYFSSGSTNNGPLGYAITGIRLEEILTGPPQILAPPTNTTVFAGDTYTFRVVAGGTPPLSYQWYKANSPIGGATSTNYSATAVYPGDNNAQFYVVVNNASGSATSVVATLTVSNSAPIILTQPQSQTVSAPSPVTFTASAIGNKPLTYQWYRNGSMIAGATNTSYTLASTSIGDSGARFSVTVFNGLGSKTSSNATLTVNAVPIYPILYTNVWKYVQNTNDLGTAWHEIVYDDSGWAQGPGWLGFETDAAGVIPMINTTLSLTEPGGARIHTYYFRTHFTLNFDPASAILVSSNYIDDGAVFYVNGHEYGRYNMDTNAVINYKSSALVASPEGTNNIFTNILPADFLVQGDNVLAVEVHQISDTSSDIDFGYGLTAIFLPPTTLAITKNPTDQTVTEAASATFSVQFSGTQPMFQWYKWSNDVPVAIVGATKRIFTITNTAFSDAGFYFVAVGNGLGTVYSSAALLTVLTDLSGPTLVFADGSLNPTNVTVSFSEFIGAATATNIANYKITNVTAGGTLAVSKAVLNNGTNVILASAARVDGANYLLIVNNVQDISSHTNTIAPNSSIGISTRLTLIDLEAIGWAFYNPLPGLDDPNPGANWTQIDFQPPSGWGSGQALFAYDPIGNDLPGEKHTDLSIGGISCYFRHFFNANFSLSDLKVTLRHVVDDGIVAYINGAEVYRFNMPAGPIATNTFASSEIGVASSISVQIPGSALRAGTNILAIELHGTDPNSDPDIVFGAELAAAITSYATGAVLVTSGPYNVTVQEGDPVTFSFQSIGAATFQWRTNGTAIPGATNSTYTVASVPASWNGKLIGVVASNPGSSATSSNATITVLPDTTPPRLLSAYATAATAITVSFSEAINQASATTLANYRVTNSAGANLALSGASLVNGTNVVLTCGTMSSLGYTLIVNNIRDASSSSNRIASNSIATVGFLISIPIDATWRFFTNNTDLQTAWRATSYNDLAAPWTSGPALIADETAALPEPIKTPISRLDNGTYHYTFYFRYHFNSPFAVNGLTATFRHIIDDGALMYLNGQQFHSFNMTNDASNVTYTTQASVNVGDGAYNGPYTTNVNLVAGDNVIGVEVHQNGTNSSDLTFGATFTIGTASVGNTILQAPPIQITKSQGTNVVVTWSGTGYILERKNVLSPAALWVPVTNQPPWTYATRISTNPAAFYRLHGSQ